MSFSALANRTDEELVEECLKRPINEAAWAECWYRFYPRVYRTVGRMFYRSSLRFTHQDVDDMVQLVFLRLFTGIHKFDRGKSPFGAYMNLLAANVVLDEFRGRKRRPVIQLDEAKLLAAEVRAGEIEIEEVWDAVLRYMEGLHVRNRLILGDVLDGVPTQQICSKHHVRQNAVYSIAYRFKKALRNGFKK